MEFGSLSPNSSLKELQLDGYTVGDAQFAMLCLSLTVNTTLQSLRSPSLSLLELLVSPVSFNKSDVSYDGYLALRDLLRANTTLKRFNFPYSSTSVIKV